ncbi:hypothetical protein FSP39_018451 [Pinctada imbricata]|uniref:Galactose mutarotase n=1 Tax=Pinctada imbricata TaxID=66713 RepID=A0AA88XX60_PINIB|nr:hypothetical protein FSP39_018451 [Pinctada imbricata]
MKVRVINYGCIITDILLPDRDGNVADINLGFDSIKGYEDGHPYFGAVVGRVANRIYGGKFELDGQEYSLNVNKPPNHLHGGVKGFDKVVWESSVADDKLVLKYTSPDGEEGYPGELTATVNYKLTDANQLVINYSARTTKPTPVNMTNHAYFNLGGQGSPDVKDHVLTIKADKYTPLNEHTIPTGEIADVEGTVYDVRTPTRLGDRMKDVNGGLGFDINFCVEQTGNLNSVAKLQHQPSGREIEVFTTEPGLQCYTGCNMKTMTGKGGATYRQFGAVCLETQHYPNSVNQENFPSTILRPGEEYQHLTVYQFSTQ